MEELQKLYEMLDEMNTATEEEIEELTKQQQQQILSAIKNQVSIVHESLKTMEVI